MYTAKHRGKGVWQVYDASMAGDGLLEIELRADLKQAIEAGELSVAYQPIVELATRRTVGVEALARWTHRTRGEIEPSQFIPLAEAAELIVPARSMGPPAGVPDGPGLAGVVGRTGRPAPQRQHLAAPAAPPLDRRATSGRRSPTRASSRPA